MNATSTSATRIDSPEITAAKEAAYCDGVVALNTGIAQARVISTWRELIKAIGWPYGVANDIATMYIDGYLDAMNYTQASKLADELATRQLVSQSINGRNSII